MQQEQIAVAYAPESAWPAGYILKDKYEIVQRYVKASLPRASPR